MPLPDSVSSLRTFLGLASYVGQRHVAHFSTMIAPLWELTKQGSTELEWTESRKQAFEHVRSAIANATIRSYFDPDQTTVVQVDASGIGLGAVVLQGESIISLTSRSLTPIEQRYSQIEREFLAIVFALKRFSSILLCQHFELHTDHAPLLRILRKPLDTVEAAMQRWIVAIQHYSFEVKHIKGCLLYTSPSPRDLSTSRMPSSA